MTALVGQVAPPAMHVMSFNIRRRMAEPLTWRAADRWVGRRERVRQLVRAEQPALLGVQEAMPDQAAALADALGKRYRFIGYGREVGRRGEACPLFFDAGRLELEEWTQTALSTRPLEAGSRSWGALVPRVVVSATFHDTETGARFVVMNTHLDPFSQRSRTEAARMLRTAAASADHPVVVMGDFNAPAGGSTWRAMTADGVLHDTWDTAKRRLTPEWGTFADYRPPKLRAGRIDGILVSGSVVTEQVAIDASPVGGAWPSDHLPVHAVVRIPAAAA